MISRLILAPSSKIRTYRGCFFLKKRNRTCLSKLYDLYLTMDFSLTEFTLQSYADIAPYYEDLLQRICTTKEETLQWIADYDHLDAVITEDVTWRYIHHTCDTKNEEYEKAYMTFLMEISPKIQEVSDALNKKIVSLPAIDEITSEDQAYAIWHKGIKQAIDMFREDNIPLNTRDADLAKQYGEISAAMSIEYDGKTMTLQQAATYVELPDRAVRKEVYEKIWERRLADAARIDALMDEMVQLRDQMARNAGYPHFAAYAWDARGRFDYTQQHVFDFHKGVKEHVVPVVAAIYEQKAQALGLETLKPYDLSAPVASEKVLRPFVDADELLQK